MNPAERILRCLASHLRGPAHIRLMGGAALILGYGRATEDADLLMEDAELEAFIESADLGHAVEKTNRELEPLGLYLTDIWGPEQQILTPEWKWNCRRLDRDWGSGNLTVWVLGSLDLILSKMCRADDEDMTDVQHIIAVEGFEPAVVEHAVARAVVPAEFLDVFPDNAQRLLALLAVAGD